MITKEQKEELKPGSILKMNQDESGLFSLWLMLTPFETTKLMDGHSIRTQLMCIFSSNNNIWKVGYQGYDSLNDWANWHWTVVKK